MKNDQTAGACPFRLGDSGQGNHWEAAMLSGTEAAPQVELPGGVRARAVVSDRLARNLLLNPAVSRDARLHSNLYPDGVLQADGVVGVWVGTRNALNSYGSDHRRLRRPLAAALNRRQVSELTPVIETVVSGLLAEIEAMGHNRVDLISAFARQVPMRVITKLLGIPAAQHENFQRATAALFDTEVPVEQASASGKFIASLLNELIHVKRQQLGEDLISDLIRAADAETQTLSTDELRDQVLLLITAGTETTVTSIATLLSDLLTYPDQRERIVLGQATLNDALDESLRRNGPLANIPLRFAVEDFTDEETGTTFTRGEAILINFAAAGRDPEAHGESVEAYDVTRRTRDRHLAFGLGVHLCPGATLARRESVLAVEGWLRRFPDSRLAVGDGIAKRLPSWITNGYESLPIELRASATAISSAPTGKASS